MTFQVILIIQTLQWITKCLVFPEMIKFLCCPPFLVVFFLSFLQLTFRCLSLHLCIQSSQLIYEDRNYAFIFHGISHCAELRVATQWILDLRNCQNSLCSSEWVILSWELFLFIFLLAFPRKSEAGKLGIRMPRGQSLPASLVRPHLCSKVELCCFSPRPFL